MSLAPVAETRLTSWAQDLAPARQLAEIVAGTDFVPAALRGNPDACCACIMYGLSIGVEPMVALQSIHVVDGRPQPSAELARALILAAGHQLTIHTATETVCRVSGLRKGEPESQRLAVDWTIDQARKAGLLNRQNWQRYPRAMLLARATGDLGRILFPDALKGLGHISEADPDELETWANQTLGEPEPEAPKRAVRRRRQLAGRPVESVPLPEAVPDGEPEPGRMDPPPWQGSLDPWAQDSPPPAGSPPGDPPHAPQVGTPTPDPEQVPEGQAMSASQRGALMAQTSRLGIDPTTDRAQRLALWSALLGRKLSSGRELSRGDALTLLGRMAEVETGAVEMDYSVETNAVTLRRVERMPPDE